MTSKVDEDLVCILQNLSINADARLQGWEYVLSLTGTEAGMKQILAYKKYLPFFISYIKETNAEKDSLNHVYKCLINISSTEEGSCAMLKAEKGFTIWLLNGICDAKSDFIESKCYILSNLSNHCNILKQDMVSSVFPDLWTKKIKNCFCSTDSEVRERYKFLAFLFANISRTPEGRKLLVQNDNFLETFPSCFNPEEADIRRLGMALTIRNCLFETSSHERLLEELNILPILLLPLMGPEEHEEEDMDQFPIECQYLESSKEREKIPQVRKALVQAVSLLCYTEYGWQYLKNKGVYVIARELHKWESDPNVNEAIETLVGYMLVMNYTDPNLTSKQAIGTDIVIPTETDLVYDIPDFVIK